MSFVQFFRILWARRWIVVAATLGCFLAALLASRILPPRYEAKSRVMMELIKPDPVTGQVISTNFARAYTRTQTELIRDYRTTGAVVDALGWTGSPELLARFNATGRGESGDFRRWLAQLVADNTEAAAIDASNILEITYTSNNPETARAVADAVRAAYIDQSLSFKRESASKSADWFDAQVIKTRNQLAAADSRKTAFERANRVILNADSTDVESSRLQALATQSEMRTPAMPVAPTTSPARLQLAGLDARIATVSQTLGPNHPDLQELRQQRGALAAAAAQESAAPRMIGGSGPSLAGQVAAQQKRVFAQRDKVEEARRLQADVAVLREQYAKTAGRAAEFRQQAESNESGLTLLGSAMTPEEPSFPNMPLIIFGSLGLGLALGVLASLITELLSRRVRGVEDLAHTGVPVIVVLNGWSPRPARVPLMRRIGLRKANAA